MNVVWLIALSCNLFSKLLASKYCVKGTAKVLPWKGPFAYFVSFKAEYQDTALPESSRQLRERASAIRSTPLDSIIVGKWRAKTLVKKDFTAWESFEGISVIGTNGFE